MALIDRKQREKQARRDLILKSALSTFARHGYHGTSMDAIAEAAELGKATLYYYFKSKDQLLLAILEAGLEKFFSQLETRWIETSEILEKIGAVTEVGALFFAEHPDYFKLYHYLTAHPALRQKAFTKLHPIIVEKTRRIQALFHVAQQQGLIRKFPLDHLIEIFGSLVMGMGFFTHPPLGKEKLLARANLINLIFLHGILTNPKGDLHA